MMDRNTIISFVGMPGAGKTEATQYLKGKGIPYVRFGDVTDKGLQEKGIPLTEDNERSFREQIRRELGMGAYAIKAESDISKMLKEHQAIVIEGMRSWEEYTYLKERFPSLIVVSIYAEPRVRYSRLSSRPVRPLTIGEVRKRDVAELIELNMGPTIAIADYLIENNSDDKENLHQKIELLLVRLKLQ